jgi:methyltransferase (TIGR00027 family)
MKPVSKTAYYTAGVRMLDAKLPKPICGDNYAYLFMNETGMEVLNATRKLIASRINAVQRHQIIDELLQKQLQINEKQKIFIIGAGFDSRAYRLKGGNWLELDEPEVIAEKENKLPAINCPNKLTRVAINFSEEKITDLLQEYSTIEEVTIIIEGVSMYLTESQFADTLQQFEKLFPNHTLICDLLTKRFFYFFGRWLHKRLNDFGAVFHFRNNHPQDFIVKQGYELLNTISVPNTAIKKGNLIIPKPLQLIFKSALVKGYTINIFSKKK